MSGKLKSNLNIIIPINLIYGIFPKRIEYSKFRLNILKYVLLD